MSSMEKELHNQILDGFANSSALIIFVGMDGSGKSTLAGYLSDELKKKDYDVSYIWWLEGENSHARRIIRYIGKFRFFIKGSRDATSGQFRTDNTKSKSFFFRGLYPYVVLLDYLRFGILKLWIPLLLKRNKIIIMDRSFYDVILSLSKEFDFSVSKKRVIFKIFYNIMPMPDLIFFIDVSPEISYLRKNNEFESLEHSIAIWQGLQELRNLLGGLMPGRIELIDNCGDIELSKSRIIERSLALEVDINGV